MVAGDQSTATDCLVVGGGPGGYVAAIRAAQCGRSVTLVERDQLGGTCLNAGCIPSKALAEMVGARMRVTMFAPAGLGVGDVIFNMARFQAWKADLVEHLADGVSQLLAKHKVEVLRGTARFVARTRVAVEAADGLVQFFDFDDVVLAPGTGAVPHPRFPFDHVRVVDPADALSWTDLPASLVVVGSDYIAVELGVAFARLGCQVTIADTASRLLSHLDRDLSRAGLRACRNAGVEVKLGCEVRHIDDLCVVVADAFGELAIECERVMVCLGRRGDLKALDAHVVGLDADQAFVKVDSQLRISRHVYAVGDITDGLALAHRAMAQGQVAGEVLGGLRSSMDARALPQVIYCEPQIASVGLALEEARSMGHQASAARFPLSALGRAAIALDDLGFAKVVFDRDEGRLLGVHMVGPHAAEVIGEAALAIEMGAYLEDLASTLHFHPSFAEALSQAAQVGLGRPLHGGSASDK